MTSAIFQSDGKVEVPSEQLIISVIGPSITCRASLNTLALVLSGPGALFNGKDKLVRLTSTVLTGVKLKQSSKDDTRSGMDEFEQMILFSNASFATASAARLPERVQSIRFPFNLPGLFFISVNIPLIAFILYTGSTNILVVLEILIIFFEF